MSRRGRRNISEPVNCGSTDVDTRLGKLVHDFKCTSSSDMFYEVLAARVNYLKETKGGIRHMSDICKGIEIFGAIGADLRLNMDDDEIIDDLMVAYHLTRDMAEEYLQEYYAENRVKT